MSRQLRERARAFLERPIPEGMPYVPDSISERFIAVYAERGQLEPDPETVELLRICAVEAENAASMKTGEEQAFFRESGAILEAIFEEMQEPHKSPSQKRPWWKLW